MMPSGILLMFHCEQNTGYAIRRLEEVFLEASMAAGFSADSIFWSFIKIGEQAQKNVLECDYKSTKDCHKLAAFLVDNNIKLAITSNQR